MTKDYFCAKKERVRLLPRIGELCERYSCRFVEVVELPNTNAR